jgi:hypothetical protein
MEETTMKTCQNCTEAFRGEGDNCRPCVERFQAEAAAHEASADAERFEVELLEQAWDYERDADTAYMGGIDSDLLGEN